MAHFEWRSPLKMADQNMRQIVQSLERFLNERLKELRFPPTFIGINGANVSTTSSTLTALTLPTGGDVLADQSDVGSVSGASFTSAVDGFLGVQVVALFAAATTGERYVEVYNSSTATAVPVGGTVQTVSYSTRVGGAVTVPVAVGDVIQVRARQTSGSALNARVERVQFSRVSE